MSWRRKRLDQAGVTLVELLIVLALLTVFLAIIGSLFATAIDTESQSEGYDATISDGRFIMARLDYDITHASAITTPASLGASGASLVMTVNSATYTYALNGSNLQLTDATGSDNLNSDGTTVSGLSFQRIGNTGGKDTIRYSFVLISTAHHGSGTDTQTFTSTAERR